MRRSAKKQQKCLKMLPKEYAVNVIQYKLDYKKYQKNNPIYRKTQNIVPWKLMGQMSDEILDEVLLGVTKEIELDKILEPIYQSELQL
ncbi:unnamed protein product [Acanthoscelides obtectus]|nr:unnamed protein product [Acanthoscelides obtectus]CAK1638096.1 hypothetical protein AOBTE_LOCUS10386 [Acanthoscelides obtectus]